MNTPQSHSLKRANISLNSPSIEDRHNIITIIHQTPTNNNKIGDTTNNNNNINRPTNTSDIIPTMAKNHSNANNNAITKQNRHKTLNNYTNTTVDELIKDYTALNDSAYHDITSLRQPIPGRLDNNNISTFTSTVPISTTPPYSNHHGHDTRTHVNKGNTITNIVQGHSHHQKREDVTRLVF